MNSVALVNMPWNSVRRGAISLGILKALLQEQGIGSDVLYLNIRMANLMRKTVGLVDYETLSDTHLLGEWLFSQHLFGKYGSGDLNNSYRELLEGSWQDVEDTIGVKPLLEEIQFDFEKISEEVIPAFIEDCMNRVPWHQYAIVGFSSVFNQNVASLLLSRRIKEIYPDIRIVFGGSNVHSVMGQAAIKAFDWIDYVVDGEGEPVFPTLVKNILAGKLYEQLPGVSLRNGDDVVLHKGLPPMYHLDSAPAPDYSEYFTELESCGLSHVDKFILFESSRGCWWGEKAHCTFCGLNGQYMKFRSKSAEKVINEVLTQSSLFKTRYFYSVDNILDMKSFSDLLPQFAQEGLDLELFYEVKSCLNKEQVDLLRSAGVKYIQPGIESLHTEILKLMKKGVTAIQNIQLLKFCQAAGIHVSWNILYGFPGENGSQYEQMYDTMSRISHLQPPVAATRIILQRFSPYHFDAERLGIRNMKPASLYRHIYPADQVSLEDIAYYFDYSLDDSFADPEGYIGPVKEAVAQWRSAHTAKSIQFTYRKGPGFIELKDSRPVDLNQSSGEERRFLLSGIESEVYELCESIRAFRDIVAHVAARDSSGQAEQRTREMLNNMVENHLIFAEKEKYLALAIPARPFGKLNRKGRTSSAPSNGLRSA